jgi:hypothetical protein
VHVAQEVLASRTLHDRHEALVFDERVVADRELAPGDARPGEPPGVELGRVDHDVEPAVRQELDPPARAVRPDGLLGPEEDLLVGARAVLERLLDLQELAPLPLRAVEGDRELAAEAREVGDPHALEGLEVLRRVELGLAQAEDLLPGARPVTLRAHRQQRAAVLLDRDADLLSTHRRDPSVEHWRYEPRGGGPDSSRAGLCSGTLSRPSECRSEPRRLPCSGPR